MSDPLQSFEAPDLHRELRGLPDPKAPPELAPRVMARLASSRVLGTLPWWRRPMPAWPMPARLCGEGALVLVVLAVLWGPSWIPVRNPYPGGMEMLWMFTGLAESLLQAFHRLLASIPTAVYVVLVVAFSLAYLGSLALGALVYRQLTHRR